MGVVNPAITRVFDVLFAPISAGPWLGMVVISLLTGVVLLLIFRRSDPVVRSLGVDGCINGRGRTGRLHDAGCGCTEQAPNHNQRENELSHGCSSFGPITPARDRRTSSEST